MAGAKPKPAAQPPSDDETKTEAVKVTFDVAFPPPENVPAEALQGALVVVKSKAERGFRRAGHAFTREETEIPYTELSDAQREALANEPELIVVLRVVRPD